DMGYPMDYLDEKYACRKCRDTGYNGMEICSCLTELYQEEQRLELPALLKLGEATYDTFHLDYFADTPDPATERSPRRTLDIVYAICVRYAETVVTGADNLFLTGSPGLGKTFLSTCIAKVVPERGFSVVYDTAASIFSNFEEEKFAKPADFSALASEIRWYMT